MYKLNDYKSVVDKLYNRFKYKFYPNEDDFYQDLWLNLSEIYRKLDDDKLTKDITPLLYSSLKHKTLDSFRHRKSVQFVQLREDHIIETVEHIKLMDLSIMLHQWSSLPGVQGSKILKYIRKACNGEDVHLETRSRYFKRFKKFVRLGR